MTPGRYSDWVSVLMDSADRESTTLQFTRLKRENPCFSGVGRGDRAADCAALEMLCPGNRTGGSNPPLSVLMTADEP